MSEFAWRILALFIEQTQHGYQGEWGRGYFAAWTVGKMLGGDATTIQGVTTKHHPRNEYEKALRELINLGIVEELPDLGERFRLVVIDSHDEKEEKK